MNGTYYLVEQAVFLTYLTRRSADGRNESALLAATEGASQADLDAALDWASRVETFDAEYDARNLFFFPTTDDAFAIGRLTPAAPESGDGAFYFQTFFIEERAFFKCGANPVALLHLALNTARFALYRPGAALEAFRLEARAPWIGQEDLYRTTDRLGTRGVTTLIQTVLDSRRTAFVADYNAFLVVAALFELTPIHWRTELTFAVGVRFRDDSSLRLIGATAERGGEKPSVEPGTAFCDLREIDDDDDARPLENAWAALVELALNGNRVDYLYERMAEEFFLYPKAEDDGRDASSDEIAELGFLWRAGLESAIRGEDEDVPRAENERDDAANDESESFFDGEFEGGWRDSDGDEGWRVDDASETAEKRPAPGERGAPTFIYRIVETTETERDDAEDDREKGRENDAERKKDDNNVNMGARFRPAESLDDIFAGESFEDEWAATEKGRGENDGAKGANPAVERKRDGDKKKERGENGDAEGRAKSRAEKKAAALAELRRILLGKTPVVGAGGKGRWARVGGIDEIEKLIEEEQAFDEPLGLDGLASLSALLGERGAEALERLRRATRRVEDERQTSERDALRLRLAPFAALSAEFPGWNEELRRFDALFDDACAGNAAASNELRDFWRRWRRELDDKTRDRIRDAYGERLRGRLTAEDGGSVARMERLLAALEIYSALFLQIDGRRTVDGEEK